MSRRGLAAALVGAALAASAVACGWLDSPPSSAITQCSGVGLASARTDILFVVDDSASMDTSQTNLQTSFTSFINTLASSPAKNDFQIGITTTSIDEPTWLNGVVGGTVLMNDTFMRGGPNSGAPYPKGALVALDDTGRYVSSPRVLRGDSTTLIADFQRNVKVGVLGSGKEQGLRAAILALTDRIADGTNTGFLRQGARLAVIVVSDEDDCSDPYSPPHVVGDPNQCHDQTVKNLNDTVPAPAGQLRAIAEYVNDLRTTPFGGEPRSVLVAGIVGVDDAGNAAGNTTGCPTATDAGQRYKMFVSDFGSSGLLDSICKTSFAATLEHIATLISQEVTLQQAPYDWHLLSVGVIRASGETVSCVLGPAGDTTADVVYAEPTATKPPTLTFQSQKCQIHAGDQIDLKLVCAG